MRYLHRVSPLGGVAYKRAFDDGFSPEVVFIAAKEARARSITAALEAAKKRMDLSEHLHASACTVPEFVTVVTRSSASSNAGVAPASRELLRLFYAQAVNALKAARATLREANAQHRLSLPLPEYPGSSQKVLALLEETKATRE